MNHDDDNDTAILSLCEELLASGRTRKSAALLDQISGHFPRPYDRTRYDIVTFAIDARAGTLAQAFRTFHAAQSGSSNINVLRGLIARLAYLRQFDLARACVDHAVSTDFLASRDMIYDQLRETISGAARYLDDIVNMSASGPGEQVGLREFQDETRATFTELGRSDDFVATVRRHDVFTETRPVGELRSTFAQDFADVDEPTRAELELRDFSARVARDRPDGGFCYHGARIGGLSARTLCVFDRHGRARPSQMPLAGQVLNATIAMPVTRTVDNAILIPMSFAPRNYGHTLAEMCYGLRALDWFPADWPIIAEYDDFGLLSHFVDAMNIDRSRIMTIEAARKTYFHSLVAPRYPYFFWTERQYRFFQRFRKPQAMRRNCIYISRSISRRPLKNEAIIEDYLKSRGASIVHTENLSIAQQIDLFSGSDLVIAPHGAGLSNMIFCRKGARVIELFRREYIRPTYYLQSTNCDLHYSCLVLENDGLDVQRLGAAIDRSLAAPAPQPA